MIKLVENREEWDEFVKGSDGHPLQLWAWGEIKKRSENWSASRLLVDDLGGAQILIRKLPKPFKSMAYIPRGPVVKNRNQRTKVLAQLSEWVKDQGSIELKIEPDWLDTTGLENFKKSKNQILIPNTMCVDLNKDKEELLSDMEGKTRQNIRRSLKYGVTARLAAPDDFPKIMKIYHETATRAGFGLHTEKYYADIMELFGDDSRIYVAEREGQIISFVWCVATPLISFELYGGMNDEGKKYRSNFALKWLAMLSEQERGTKFYDMNGLLQGGVSDFKRGFASMETKWVGAYDKPLSPMYNLYEKALPTGKKLIQKISNR